MSPETHRVRGTWRADRHAVPAAGNVVAMPMAAAEIEPDVTGLGPAGRRLVADLLARSELTEPLESVLLTEAGHLADRLAALRAAGPPEDTRLELALQRQLAALLAALRTS